MIKLNKIYLLCFIFLGVISLIYGGTLFYYTFYSMLFLLFAAVFYVLLLSKLLKVEVILGSGISTVGEINNCRIIVKVDKDMPIPYIAVKASALEIQNNEYRGKIIDIAYDESMWIDCPLKFYKRGIYDPAEVEVTYFDLFKIICVKKIYSSCKLIKVYPKIFNISETLKFNKDFYGKNINLNGMKEDIYFIKDVKPYREGDSLNKVHWKLSAKIGEMYTKNTDKISGQEVTLLVDFNKDNYSYGSEENVCELFLSIIHYLTSNEINSVVYFNDCNSQDFSISNIVEFYKLMEYVINKKSDGDKAFSMFLQEKALSVNKGSDLIIVTSYIDKALSDTLEYYNKIGYRPVVFYCIDNKLFSDNITHLNNLGIATINISIINGEEIKWCR